MCLAPAARAAALVVCFGLAGCESNNKGKIEGTKWSCIDQTVKGQRVPEGSLKLEFKSDGKLVYTVASTIYTGTYKLSMGDRVTLRLDQPLAGSKRHDEAVKIDGGKLTMTDGDGTAAVFKKVPN